MKNVEIHQNGKIRVFTNIIKSTKIVLVIITELFFLKLENSINDLL